MYIVCKQIAFGEPTFDVCGNIRACVKVFTFRRGKKTNYRSVDKFYPRLRNIFQTALFIIRLAQNTPHHIPGGARVGATGLCRRPFYKKGDGGQGLVKVMNKFCIHNVFHIFFGGV